MIVSIVLRYDILHHVGKDSFLRFVSIAFATSSISTDDMRGNDCEVRKGSMRIRVTSNLEHVSLYYCQVTCADRASGRE